MSQMTITPIPDKVFGATATGVSLRDIDDAQFAALHAAFLKYGFLIFPGQFLTDEENIAFGKPEATRMVAENCMRLAEGAR